MIKGVFLATDRTTQFKLEGDMLTIQVLALDPMEAMKGRQDYFWRDTARYKLEEIPMPTCDRKKSDMTPCVITDGDMCYAMGQGNEPVCVGCGRHAKFLPVPRPADWDQQVATWKDEQRGGRKPKRRK